MKTSLIVDDSRMIRNYLRSSLQALGFEVREAVNGCEAVIRCEESMPDLILLDWHMPVMDGLEFIRLLREGGGALQPKVVFCTTESDIAHIRIALEAGADEYVMKPFDRETLHMKLQLVGAA
ncbi:response regulator [Novosphingobium mathurense]|uniref:Two-component system, chemotaxis family, response regulator CheY n=1 Tax=Novosphingobium mathurense TaxID=428990 RepID=A0A1U6I7R9_9SPHN|nr:response regulator [Novosphingobium mathurense]SLK04056.1 two-component system, chemotaxis family, response regulator CheY [Novosphingobium mathurense]